MTAWFEPETASALSFLWLLALLGGMGGLAHQGRYKTLITAVHTSAFVLGLVVLALAGLARFLLQPNHVVLPLLVVGAALALACGSTLPVMRRAYRDAENRRIAARDL
jgi:hypothetical protein